MFHHDRRQPYQVLSSLLQMRFKCKMLPLIYILGDIASVLWKYDWTKRILYVRRWKQLLAIRMDFWSTWHSMRKWQVMWDREFDRYLYNFSKCLWNIYIVFRGFKERRQILRLFKRNNSHEFLSHYFKYYIQVVGVSLSCYSLFYPKSTVTYFLFKQT